MKPTAFADLLRSRGISEVHADGARRAAYSSDASLYRVTPKAVVYPRDAEEAALTLAVCRTEGVPVTARGAGTSVAGNAVGTGVVLDRTCACVKAMELASIRRCSTPGK